MKRKTVVIIDDNQKIIELLSTIIRRDDRFEIIGTATDGEDGYKLLDKLSPDIAIMDIIMPKLDGLSIIETYQKSHADKHPKFIIISGIGADCISTSAFNIGVIAYIMKPFDKINVINTICMSCGFKRISTEDFNSIKNDEYIEQETVNILHDIGMSTAYGGYKYLKDAIIMSVKDPSSIGSITKLVYPEVALINNTTPSRVERSMRNAIERTWERSLKVHELFEYLDNSRKSRPTNSEFIAIIADKIRLDLKNNDRKEAS